MSGKDRKDAIKYIATSGETFLPALRNLTKETKAKRVQDVVDAVNAVDAMGGHFPPGAADAYCFGLVIAFAAHKLSKNGLALLLTNNGFFKGALKLNPYSRDSLDEVAFKYITALEEWDVGSLVASGKLVQATTRDVCA